MSEQSAIIFEVKCMLIGQIRLITKSKWSEYYKYLPKYRCLSTFLTLSFVDIKPFRNIKSVMPLCCKKRETNCWRIIYYQWPKKPVFKFPANFGVKRIDLKIQMLTAEDGNCSYNRSAKPISKQRAFNHIIKHEVSESVSQWVSESVNQWICMVTLSPFFNKFSFLSTLAKWKENKQATVDCFQNCVNKSETRWLYFRFFLF